MNNNNTPMRFACDALPDCAGQIVERVGGFVIIEGMATDSGYWFAKGTGGARRFQSRQEAVDYIAYAQDQAQDELTPQEKKRLEDLKVKQGIAKLSSKEQDEMITLLNKKKAAKDVSVSEAQHKAMGAAAGGKSKLGIPKAVGEEFSRADKGKGFADNNNDYEQKEKDLEKEITQLTRTVASASDPKLREMARVRLVQLKKRL